MDKLGEELDILLNEYEKLKIPNEVGSHDLTEDSEILTLEEINPEDSISNSGEEIYNIEGQIRILNGKVKEIKLNPKSEIKEIIENYNKELEIYNKLREELEEKIKNIDNKD